MSRLVMSVEFNLCLCSVCQARIPAWPEWVWFPVWPYVVEGDPWRGY